MFGLYRKTSTATRRRQRDVERLTRELADECAAHEATRRKLDIAEAEIEALASVCARDRERVQSEAAVYARRRAEAEGNPDAQRD